MPIRELCLHVVRRCNWLCDHCYYGSAPSETIITRRALPDPVQRPSVKNIMSVETAFGLLRQCKETGVRRVTIQGGEPFLHPDLRVIAAEAKRNGLLVAIPTNGNLVVEDDYEWLSEYVDLLFVSIHGLPEYHDAFVHSKGAFQKSLQTVIRCNELGIKTGVLSSVSERNRDSILSLTSQLNAEHIPMHGIFYQTEAGRGTNSGSLSIEQWEEFTNEARLLQPSLQYTRIRMEITRVSMDSIEYAPLQLEGISGLSNPAQHGELVHKGNQHSCVTCLGVEKHICFCNTEGDMYSCSLLMDQEQFRFASLRNDDSLGDYFGNMSWQWAYAHAPLPPDCQRCEFLDTCHGGCMAARGVNNSQLTGLKLCDNKKNIPICVLYPDYDVYKQYLNSKGFL